MNTKLQTLKQFLISQQIDCGLITSRHNIFYLSDFDYDPHERFIGIFVFQNGDPLIVTPAMEVQMVKEAGWKYEIISYIDTDNVWNLVKKCLEQVKTIAVEKNKISYSYIEHLVDIHPTLQLSSLDEQLDSMRLIKNQEEVENLQKAAIYADMAVRFGIEALEEGVSEIEVMAKIEYSLKQQGIREMSFAPTVLFGENASNPHGVPGEKKLNRGDVALFDLGVKYKGYCSDITRTVVFDHVTEEVKKIYGIVLAANEAGIQACQPNKRMGDLDVASRMIIANAGYGDYFPHRIGHGLGIDIHEAPSITDQNEGILKPGMVITIEPGIYINDVIGVRIEDDVVITENGCKVLTQFPKELQVVKSSKENLSI